MRAAPLPTRATLRREVQARFQRFRRDLSPRLRSVVVELVRRKTDSKAVDAWAYFCPLCLPIADLPVWTAELARRRGRCVPARFVGIAIEAGMAGYLHVRASDRVIDGSFGPASEALAAGTAAWTWHVHQLIRIAGSHPRFWSYLERTWHAHSHALLVQRDVRDGRRSADGRSFRAVLERSAPLVLPSAAMLWAVGLERDVPALETLSGHLRFAAQMLDDLIDASEDARRGHGTWFLARLGVPSGSELSFSRILSNGAFERSLADINRELRAAMVLADQLDLERAAKDIADTKFQVGQLVAEILGKWLCPERSNAEQK